MLVCPLCRIALGPNDAACPHDGNGGRDVAPRPVTAALEKRFHIISLFAQGDTGTSYLADEPETGRRGLLKVLNDAPESQSAERQRLRRELVKQATLEGPHMATPLATGEADGAAWIFREWLEGESLRVKLARGAALPTSEALSVAAQLAAGLDDLHRAGLLHRDIKPGHVFLRAGASGEVRALLIDAGLCTQHEVPGRAAFMGTPGYVAPEQLLGKLVSFRSDLYGLGCVIYEMLTGRPAFVGDSVQATLTAQLAGDLPKMPEGLPSGVGALLKSLLARDPQERPFSAQKLRRTLDPFLPDGAHLSRPSLPTHGSLPDGRKSLAPGGLGVGSLKPPGAPSRAPPPPPPRSVAPPAIKSAPPPPPPSMPPPHHGGAAASNGQRKSSLPPPSTVAKNTADRTQQLDMAQIVEMSASSPRPSLTPTAKRPPAPARESTQALDLDQLLEVVPGPARMPSRPQSVPPPRPSAPPPPLPRSEPPAQKADMTQPIRLEQILAVAQASSKKELEVKPPVQTKGLMIHDEPSIEVDMSLPRMSTPAMAPASTRASLASDDLVRAIDEDDAPPPSEDEHAPVRDGEVHEDLPPARASLAQPAEPDLASTPAQPIAPAQLAVSIAPAAAPVVATVSMQPAPAQPAPSQPAVTQPAALAQTVLGMQAPALPPAEPQVAAPVPAAGHTVTFEAAVAAAPVAPAPEPAVAQPPPALPQLDRSAVAGRTLLGMPAANAAALAASAVPSGPTTTSPDVLQAVPAIQALETPTAVRLGRDDSVTLPRNALSNTAAMRQLRYDEDERIPITMVGVGTTPTSAKIAYAVAAVAILALAIVSTIALMSNRDAPVAQVVPVPVQVPVPAAQPVPAPAPAPAPAPVAPTAEPPKPEAVAAPAPTVEPIAEAKPEPKVEDKPAARAPRASSDRPKAKGKEQDSEEELTPDAKMARWAKARDDARAHYAAKRYAQAATAYEEAARYNSGHAGTFAGLGAARMLSGDARGAIQAYQKALAISPTTSGFHTALGSAYRAAGDNAKARTAYKRALALDPKNPAAAQALSEIGE